MGKKQNFQNRYTKSLECHTGNVYSKFQVPCMFNFQINVTFVSFQYRNLKVLRVLYLQVNPDFRKFITQTWNNIYSCRFLHRLHLIEIFKKKFKKITKRVFGPLKFPEPLVALTRGSPKVGQGSPQRW